MRGEIFKDTYPMRVHDLGPDGLPLPRMLLPEKSCQALAEGLTPIIVEQISEIISFLKSEVPILLTELNAHFV